MSFTSRVVSGVPSLTHSSCPWARLVAVKNSRRPAGVSWRTTAPGPASTEDTRRVLRASPPVFQSWKPWRPSLATKYSASRQAVSSAGMASASPGLRSVTRCVPRAVPSLRHSSRPCSPSVAVK